jgi:hypothetical protein
MLKLTVMTALIILCGTNVFAVDCPPFPQQINKDWEVEVNAAVVKIGPVKGAELKTRTRNATKDLLGKLPDASKIYLEQMMFSSYCSSLRDDKTLKESEKAKLLKEYRNQVMKTVKARTGKVPLLKKSTMAQPPLELPIFTEKVENVDFSLGERGFTAGYSIAALEKQPREPFNLNNFSPVKVYIKNGRPYADVKIYGGSGLPAIEIRNNQLRNKPSNWDFNSNERPLEIVDQNYRPIYQFFYKSPSHIVINGIFPFPGGLILANESGAILNPTLPTTFVLKRIFKYPSWKYPGKIDETNDR